MPVITMQSAMACFRRPINGLHVVFFERQNARRNRGNGAAGLPARNGGCIDATAIRIRRASTGSCDFSPAAIMFCAPAGGGLGWRKLVSFPAEGACDGEGKRPMPEWAAGTPWWIVLGLAAAIVTAIVKFSRWTSRVDSTLEALGKGIAEIREDIKQIIARSAVEDGGFRQPASLDGFGPEDFRRSQGGNDNRRPGLAIPDLIASILIMQNFPASGPSTRPLT